MAYLCRCDSLPRHTQQSKGPNMVTGSVECDICESRTQREEFSLQGESTRPTSKVWEKTGEGMSGI